MAIYYKEVGPQKTTYQWETEEENSDDESIIPSDIIDYTVEDVPIVNASNQEDSIINPVYNYTFKPKNEA